MTKIDYSYGGLSRLLEADYDTGTTIYTYGYDLAGNLTNNNGTSRTFNAANQISNTGFVYDSNGNLTNDGTNSYTWDRANRLASVGSTTYKYDGLSNRIQQNTVKYLLDIQPSLAVVLGDSDGNHYVHGVRGIHAQEDSSANWEYMMQDGLGSVRGIVDDTAVVQSSMSYDPYGNPMAAYGAGFWFTGEQTDANDLVYLRARYMNPNMGTFLSLDPFEGVQNRPMSLNGYSWVEGNVPNFTDPSGKTCNCEKYKNDPPAYRACLSNPSNEHDDNTYIYDRAAAASMAIRMALQGGIPSGFATEPFTSARFMSLALHAGGFPMTTTDGTGNENVCDLTSSTGWCADFDAFSETAPRIDGNSVWNNHNDQTRDDRLIEYFSGNSKVTGSGITFSGGGVSQIITVTQVFGNREDYPEGIYSDAFPSDWVIGGRSDSSAYPNEVIYSDENISRLAQNIDTVMSGLTTFEVGDYVWVAGANAATNPSHGFMIVGSGPAVPCDDYIAENLESNIMTRPVFYIADIPGGQRGTPRPFYCSRMYDRQGDTTNYFRFSEWHFIKMPSSVTVERKRLFSPDPIRQ